MNFKKNLIKKLFDNTMNYQSFRTQSIKVYLGNKKSSDYGLCTYNIIPRFSIEFLILNMKKTLARLARRIK